MIINLITWYVFAVMQQQHCARDVFNLSLAPHPSIPKLTYGSMFSDVSPLSTEPFIHPCSFPNNDVMFRPQVVSVLFGVGNSSSSQELENLFGPGGASFEVFMLEMPMPSDLTQPNVPFNLS